MRAETNITGVWVLHDTLWQKTIIILDLDAQDTKNIIANVIEQINLKCPIDNKNLHKIKRKLTLSFNRGPKVSEHLTALFQETIRGLTTPIQILIRFKNPILLGNKDETRTKFAWILLSETQTHPFISSVAEFFKLMGYRWFRKRAIETQEITNLYKEGLKKVLSFDLNKTELQPAEGFFNGIKKDLQTRIPHYINDISCGFNLKVLASILFMFFACAAPAVAFGALTDSLTNGQIGVIETILACAVAGIIWSIISGQPLVIIGPTGPNIIFTGILYKACNYFHIPFLATAFWVGMWTAIFLFILAAINASTMIRYFTRFTDEIFAALIALIFISEALSDIYRILNDSNIPDSSALLSLLLALGTFITAITLSRVRRTPYLRNNVREFLSDFGPAIALFIMTFVSTKFPGVTLDKLNVPLTFKATQDRAWLVNPFEAPVWVYFTTSLPALLLTILVWVNQNITARLVNNSEHKLKKGTSYHWDIFAIGILIATMSIFGLPWVVGAAVRSINHVRSLLVTEKEKVLRAIETRNSNFGIHALLAISLFALPILKVMPMAVLYGIFLFMGFGSLGGNQFIGRIKLLFMDPNLLEPTHQFRAVPIRTIHTFTGIQLVCLGILWIVKQSLIGIIFPLFVAMLVPIRILITKFIEAEYVALLDLEEAPEKFRDFGS